mmetsp:Transcript_29121/g.76920  ORF Transcript_29121/g.76920 Transcript_29121/m.76920 type:complete len:100 (-) Transcript_29121:1021-1320(-)
MSPPKDTKRSNRHKITTPNDMRAASVNEKADARAEDHENTVFHFAVKRAQILPVGDPKRATCVMQIPVGLNHFIAYSSLDSALHLELCSLAEPSPQDKL